MHRSKPAMAGILHPPIGYHKSCNGSTHADSLHAQSDLVIRICLRVCREDVQSNLAVIRATKVRIFPEF